jgi:hypothetical protein
MRLFQQGDVYIGYPYDDAKFRYEHATSKVFCRLSNSDEVAVGYTDNLFRDAMRSSTQIDREQYFGD